MHKLSVAVGVIIPTIPRTVTPTTPTHTRTIVRMHTPTTDHTLTVPMPTAVMAPGFGQDGVGGGGGSKPTALLPACNRLNQDAGFMTPGKAPTISGIGVFLSR